MVMVMVILISRRGAICSKVLEGTVTTMDQKKWMLLGGEQASSGIKVPNGELNVVDLVNSLGSWLQTQKSCGREWRHGRPIHSNEHTQFP